MRRWCGWSGDSRCDGDAGQHSWMALAAQGGEGRGARGGSDMQRGHVRGALDERAVDCAEEAAACG
jgi:hypothetical protein